MKILKLTICLFAIASFLPACKKHTIEALPIDFTPTSTQANIKIVYASAYTTNYKVQLKTNDTRISGIITYSTPFPGGGLNTGGANFPDYYSIKPGAVKIGVSVPNNLMNTDSIALSSNVVNVAAGKFYTIYLSDTAASTKAFVVTEAKAPVEGDFSNFKFVNTIPNSTAIDLYFDGVLVAPNVAYQAVSPDFKLIRGATGQWAIRAAGALPNSAPIAVYPSGTGKMTVPNKLTMSVYSRGYLGKTGNLIPAISLLYN